MSDQDQKGISTYKRLLVKFAAITLALALLLSLAAPALARQDRPALGGNVPPAPSAGRGPTDPAELETFMDGLLAQEMEEYSLASAVVSVVKDGKLFFAKGYGYANIDKKLPVDPQTTGFQIGSVIKLFTWTAVMQLVEQGKLDLDTDINEYLDFRIPDTYPQPITLKNLMTHTPGFEDRSFEQNTTSTDDFIPVRDWLVSHIPARVRPPGEAPAYSNYGAALAGYIISRVSGQPYDQYIQEHILDPLGMTHTTAHWPMPPEFSALAAVPYMYVDGVPQIFPNYYSQLAIVPAGGMQSSAADMARIMIAHLQDGLYSDAEISGVRILNESTAQQMHTTLYRPDPQILGTAYGLFDFSDNGQRTLGHSGGADPFHTLLLLLPDQDLGIFVVFNGNGGGILNRQHLGFQRAFFDHYYPVPAVQPIQPPADFAERAGRFTGTYKMTLSTYTTIQKYGVIGMGLTVQIKDPGDGTLEFATPYGDWRFVETQPLLFRQVDGPYSIAFREDGEGRIRYLFADLTPMMAFEKVSWYELPAFNMALVMVCILFFLTMAVTAAVRAIRNRQSPASRGSRTAQWLILAICILNLLFVTGTVVFGEQALNPMFGISLTYKLVLGLAVVSALLTAGALVYTVLAWKDGYWGAAFRTFYTLTTIAAVAFVWFLNFWNLLGWRF